TAPRPARGPSCGPASAVVLERDRHPHPVAGGLPLLDRDVLLHHLGHAEVAQALAGGGDRIGGGRFPGLGARADDLGDDVDAVSHWASLYVPIATRHYVMRNGPEANSSGVVLPAGRREVQGGGVDAVAQARGLGAVREDMPQVRLAAGADDLRAHHAVAGVPAVLHRCLARRRREARPAGARVELRVAVEELLAADDAA